jgi:peptidoglycan hydrolase-like protein with peptidoglycan-binding domain
VSDETLFELLPLSPQAQLESGRARAASPSVGPAPPAAFYICWVQHSLLRNGWPGTPVDGTDSTRYRETVEAFQADNGLPVHGQVDETTQNRLVKLNHVDTDYTAWVQDALIKAGLLDPGVKRTESIMDRASSLTRQAVRRLQQQRFDRDRGLKPDGWVGAKTEFALRAFSTTAPPDATGRPAPCRLPTPRRVTPEPVTVDDDQLFSKLRNALDWMNEYGGETLYSQELCLVRKLLNPGVDDGFVDHVRMEKFFKDNPSELHPHYFSSAKRILKRKLRARWETDRTVTVPEVVGWLKDIRQDILEGMNKAYFHLTGQHVYDPWRKPQIVRELGVRTNRSMSLYNCKFARDRYAGSIATLS